MGGCCCSSRKPQFHGTPIYYYCPPVLEEREALTSRDGTASVLSTGFMVGFNLETSIPDTFRRPPTPLPYDVVFGHRHSIDSESIQGSRSSFGTLVTCEDLDGPDFKTQTGSVLSSPKKLTSKEMKAVSSEEEDGCPICLEDYDDENPRTMTKCEHHYHLSCILEWMERSDSCPICDQDIIFDHELVDLE